MKTEEGEDELVCRTNSAEFDLPEGKVRRGVISFYATTTLPLAASVETWLRLITDAMADAVKSGRLKQSYQRLLQVVGDGKTALPKQKKSK